MFALGQELDAIRTHFGDIYDPPAGFARLPMDVEYEVVAGPDGEPVPEIKQARPYPGRGGNPSE